MLRYENHENFHSSEQNSVNTFSRYHKYTFGLDTCVPTSDKYLSIGLRSKITVFSGKTSFQYLINKQFDYIVFILVQLKINL